MVTENVRGVQGVIVSFEKTCGDWKFDDDIVSEEKIIKEITSLGYKVELSNDKKN